MPSQPRITALVLTRNESKNIERCLRSLTCVDEVVVIDAESQDDTAAKARRLGARVVVNPWPGFAEQRDFALQQTSAPWVLMVDADEEVTPELATEIREAVNIPDMDGFRIYRRNQYLGDWMDHGPWTRDSVLRLVRRQRARVTQQSVHEGLQVDGDIGYLTGRMNHYTHQTLRESVERLNRYTTLEARDRVSRRKIRWIDPFVPPVGVFLKYYLVKGCWRAGVRGWLLSSVTAMYKSVLYMKIYARQKGWIAI